MADKEKWSDGTAKGFNARFFRSVSGTPWKISWYDQTGVVQLGKTVAEIHLMEGDDHDKEICRYCSGYLVSLRSKTKGEIARHFFCFEDYLGWGYLVVISQGRFEWPSLHPPDEVVDGMAKKIMDYISEYGT